RCVMSAYSDRGSSLCRLGTRLRSEDPGNTSCFRFLWPRGDRGRWPGTRTAITMCLMPGDDGVELQLRASDDDRERVGGLLGAALADGRRTADHYRDLI